MLTSCSAAIGLPGLVSPEIMADADGLDSGDRFNSESVMTCQCRRKMTTGLRLFAKGPNPELARAVNALTC